MWADMVTAGYIVSEHCLSSGCLPHMVLLMDAHSSSLLYPKSHSFSTGLSDRSIRRVFSNLMSLLAMPICISSSSHDRSEAATFTAQFAVRIALHWLVRWMT